MAHAQTNLEMRFVLNPQSVILLPAIDRQNRYITIVRNPISQRVFKINSFGYAILEIVDAHSPSTLEDIVGKITQKYKKATWDFTGKVGQFMQRMIDESIIVQE